MRRLLIRLGLAMVVAGGHALALPRAGGEEAGSKLGRWERVRLKMDARGELFAPTGGDGGEVRRPFTATARLDFLEALGENRASREESTDGQAAEDAASDAPETSGAQTAETDAATAGNVRPPHDALGVRHFFSAVSELKIDDGGTRRSLGGATSTLIVSSSPAVAHFATDAPLTREETELLGIAFDPLLLDRLPPPADTTSWRPPAELTAALLAIDTVGRPADEPRSDAEGGSRGPPMEGPLLVCVEPAADPGASAKLLVSGTVHGAVDGVPTTIRIEGTYELDGPGRRVKSGVVRLREKRLAGHVSPGFECDATFQIARRPAEGSQAVPAADTAVLAAMQDSWDRLVAGRSTGSPLTLRLQDADRRFTLLHDTRWRVVADDARGLVLRMVDNGALLAECTVSPLPPGEAGTTLDEFRRDIERSLGGRLGRFTASDEKAGQKNEGRVLRVVSEGTIDGLPLEWRHYLVEDVLGGRTAVTFTVERRFADRFGGADRDFIAGLAPKKGSAP